MRQMVFLNEISLLHQRAVHLSQKVCKCDSVCMCVFVCLEGGGGWGKVGAL